MRYRVDLRGGHVSYDEKEYAKAVELYHEQGIRLRKCEDIFDEGIVIMGPPIVEDHTREPWNEN